MRSALLLALLLFLPRPLHAQTRTLLYTTPCTLMNQWRAFDELLGDSVTNIACIPGGPAARSPMKIVLWKHPIGPGHFAPIDSHFVQPCVPDSFPSQGPGTYYLIPHNALPGVCASNAVTLLPFDMTDVPMPTAPKSPTILRLAIFNIHGQFLRWLPVTSWQLRTLPHAPGLPRGVYWLSANTLKGRLTKRIFVR